MKRCPECSRIATDDRIAFCRIDGVRLVEDSYAFSNSKTVVLQSDEPGRGPAIDESPGAPAASTVMNDPSIAIEPTISPGHYDLEAASETIDEFKAVLPPSKSVTALPVTKDVDRNSSSRNRRWIQLAVSGAIIVFTLIGSVYYSLSHRSNGAINSLAVLPFINVNADQQLDYLSDGMTETLIYNLSQLPKLNVKARSSVFRYKGNDVTPRTVGAELNVQAVLNGRIAQRGELLTLSLELADARTENVIWSEQYNRKQTELVSLQSEIARDVSGKLRVKFASADKEKLSKNDTTNEEAYHLYLKGRYHWNKRTLKDLEKAPEYFNEAISLDPNYALAYAGLADTYVLLPFYREEPLREAMPPAREAATKALSLDSNLVEAHAALGFINTCESNFTAAEREFKLTIQLNPNYATAHSWYGTMLSYMGRHEEALIELQRALEVDPVSLICNVRYGEGLYYSRRYDEAIAQLEKTIELDADFERAHSALFAVCQAKGSYSKAIEEYARDRELTGESQTAALARDTFARSGWQGFLRAMTGGERSSGLSRHNLVVFLAALGEKDKAFAELDRSYETFGPLLRVEPLLDPLRGDPRFAGIMRRAGMQQG